MPTSNIDQKKIKANNKIVKNDGSLEKRSNGTYELSRSYIPKIYRYLERYSSLFSAFLDSGKIIFDEKISTAQVEFDIKEGYYLSFKFNPQFWMSISDLDRVFVISHEMLHIILEHIKRIKNDNILYNSGFNISMDLIVNQYLVKYFGFNRKNLCKFLQKACWIDTVFSGEKASLIEKDKNFEYYYNKIPKGKKIYVKLINNHQGLKSIPNDISEDILKNLPEDIKEELKELKELIEKNNEAGNLSSSLEKIINIPSCKPKKKWETVINRWVKKRKVEDYFTHEQWLYQNPRNEFIRNENLYLSTEKDHEDIYLEQDKINIWFFQDTSGSCASYAKRFFKSAMSIPHGPNDKFNVNLFCFDIKVHSVSFDQKKLKGFGGTSFSVIEEYIQNEIRKNNINYPDSVWIITDGLGNEVHPEYPERWHWFLIDQGSKRYIPQQSKIYNLSDFE